MVLDKAHSFLCLPAPGHPVLVHPQAAPEWMLFLFFTQEVCIEHLLCVQQRPPHIGMTTAPASRLVPPTPRRAWCLGLSLKQNH